VGCFQSVDRAVDRLKATHSRVGASRPGGQPEAQLSEIWPLHRSTGRSTRGAFLPFPDYQRADFGEAIYMPSLELISPRLKRKFLIFQVFFSKSLKEFLLLKDLSLFVLKGWKIQRKKEPLGIGFYLHLYFYLEFFPRVFLCNFDFQTLYFLTLELSIYPIYQDLVFVRKIGL